MTVAEFKRRLREETFRQYGLTGLRQAASMLEDELFRRTPVGETRRLRQAVTVKVNTGRDAIRVGYDRTTAPHADFVLEGTRPHEIVPVNAQALRFEVGGEVVFATRVQHPGTQAQPIIEESIDAVIGDIETMLENLGQRFWIEVIR